MCTGQRGILKPAGLLSRPQPGLTTHRRGPYLSDCVFMKRKKHLHRIGNFWKSQNKLLGFVSGIAWVLTLNGHQETQTDPLCREEAVLSSQPQISYLPPPAPNFLLLYVLNSLERKMVVPGAESPHSDEQKRLGSWPAES